MSNQLYSMTTEQAVLCTLMTVDNSFEQLNPKLKSDDFYAARHRMVFDVIESLVLRGEKYDATMVSESLKSRKQLELIGGEDYLTQIMMESPTSLFNVNSYAAIVRDFTQRRKLDGIGQAIMALAQDTENKEYIEQAQDLTTSLESQINQKHRFTLQEACEEGLQVIVQKLERTQGKSDLAYGVNTGLRDLDAILGDIEPSHFCVIAAAPGAGKSTLAQMITINAVKRNNSPTLFISAEMPAIQVSNRIVSALARIPFERIKNGTMQDEDYGAYIHFTAKLAGEYPLDIIDTPLPSISAIRSEAKKTQSKYGKLGCIVVDYIQLIRGPKANTRFDEVSEISKSLKGMAKEFECPVIALSQLTKAALGKKPTLSDIRESGQIAQDADQVILLSSDDRQPGVTIINVAKNRHGVTRETRVRNALEYCQFADIGPENFFNGVDHD